MTDLNEAELAREFARRGLTRRQVMTIGARLGLSSATLAAVLALHQRETAASSTAGATAKRAQNQGSIFDKNAGADGPWPQTAVPEPTEKITLSVSHAWDATFMERQNQFDELFTQRHPNIGIAAENTSPFSDYLPKYTTQAAGGKLPDIMYTQFSWAQQFIQNDLFIAVDDYIAKQPDFNLPDFTPQSLVSYKYQDKLWGVPYDEGPANLYYNRDLFDKAGIGYPDETWTLDSLKDAALKLTSGEGGDKIYGLGELPTPGDALMAPPYLFPFGAQYVSEPKEDECLIGKPEAVQAMQWWEELRDKGAVPNPDEMASVAWPPFQFGKIAMTQQGSWATPPIRAGSKFNWDIAMWPAGPQKHSTFSAGSCYAITRDAKNQDAAWIYLNDYLSTAGQVYMWALTGRGSPARLSAWPAYLESEFAPPGAKYVQQAMAQGIASHDIIDQPTGPQVTQTAGPIWDEVIAGNMSVEDALNEVCAEISPLLAKNKS
ncbi:MAG TPA: sugar ABC transporter substrate-binding protein [Thermomicrobiales bacterium]|jgi:multiple sugar transport system substrate-binding protein